MIEFFYLDVAGIDSLYAQQSDIAKQTVKEISEKSGSKSGALTPKGELGGRLAKFGLASFNVDSKVELSKGTKTTSEATYEYHTENKLVEIIKVLNNSGALYHSIDQALGAGKNAFCLFEGTFQLDDWRDSDRDYWRVQANKNGMLVFHILGRQNVKMGMSLKKTTVGGRISSVSHMAIRARNSNGKLQFNVFCAVQAGFIKPY